MTVFNKFLKLLKIQANKPSIKNLEKIVEAHMLTIPFENLSKLFYYEAYGLKDIPTFEQYLEGIEKYHFGGTCYSNNYYLNQLLNELGYQVKLCGTDMDNPDVHLINMLKLEGREFIIDTGYAAPFVKPLPRDLNTDYTVSLGNETYILSPQDEHNHSKLSMLRNGEPYHGYLVKPEAKKIEDFKSVITESFRSDAAFMNSLLMVKNGLNHSLRIHNFTLIESKAKAVQKTEISSLKNLVKKIELFFNIPSSISFETLKSIDFSKDAWD